MSIAETVIGWLAPPICIACGTEGRSLCPPCAAAEIIPFGERCWHCNALSPRARTCNSCRRSGTPRSVWVATDYDGIAKDLIQKYKFGQQRAVAKTLSGLMSGTFWNFISKEDIAKTNYLIIPVPTATSRVRQRGFDHAALLAQQLAKELQIPAEPVLWRLGQSRQLGTKRDERLKQAHGSYIVRKPSAVSGRNILLVDDVVTTGATLQAATQALRQAGATHVDALVFAKRL
jgi:ComF family protein